MEIINATPDKGEEPKEKVKEAISGTEKSVDKGAEVEKEKNVIQRHKKRGSRKATNKNFLMVPGAGDFQSHRKMSNKQAAKELEIVSQLTGNQNTPEQQRRESNIVRKSLLQAAATNIATAGDPNAKQQSQNPYDEFTLNDLKVLEETIHNNRQELEKELIDIQNKKKLKKSITLQPQTARKWEKVKNQLMAFTVMKRIFSDIKKYGTSMQALSISTQVIEKCRDLLEKREVEEKKKPYMLYPDSNATWIWKTIMLCFYCYTCIFTPFKIFFMTTHREDLINLYTLDKIVEFFFFLDIIARLNTVRQDAEGNLIDSRKQVFSRYLKEGFILDILQVIPFEFIGLAYPMLDDQPIHTQDYAEIIRICRMPFILSSVNVAQRVFDYFKVRSTIQRLLRFIFTVIFSVHISGCLWVFIARVQYDVRTTWIKDIGIDNNDTVRVYLFAIYWCLQTLATVGFGDVHSTNDAEVVFALLWMVIGAGVYSFAIGQLSKMFTDSESRSAKLTNSTHIMDEFCEQAGLSQFIKDKIRKALQYSANKSLLSSSEKEDFFDSVPMRLKTGLAEGMFKGTITAVPFLKKKDSIFLANLLPMLQPLKVNKGDYVFKKDQFPNLVYFLIDGRVNYLVGPNEMTFKSFLSGSYFGEIEIFNQSLRLFSVRCEESCEFLTLDRDYLAELMDKFPNVETEMIEMAHKRQELIDEALSKIELLVNLKENDNFWNGKETQTFAEIIASRRKSQTFIEHNTEEIDIKNKTSSNMVTSQKNLLSEANLTQNSRVFPFSPNSSIQPFLFSQPSENPNAILRGSKDTNIIDKYQNSSQPAEEAAKTVSVFKIQKPPSLGLVPAQLSSQDLKNNNHNSGNAPLVRDSSNDSLSMNSSSHISQSIPNKGHVVLNVFNENKQPMLVEVYEEEVQLKQGNKVPETTTPKQMDLTTANQGTNQISKIQQKYGVGTLDCIEEKISHCDLENQSFNGCPPSPSRGSMTSINPSQLQQGSQFQQNNSNKPRRPSIFSEQNTLQLDQQQHQLQQQQGPAAPAPVSLAEQNSESPTSILIIPQSDSHKLRETFSEALLKSTPVNRSENNQKGSEQQQQSSPSSALKRAQTTQQKDSNKTENKPQTQQIIRNQNTIKNKDDDQYKAFPSSAIQNSLQDIVMLDSSSDDSPSQKSKVLRRASKSEFGGFFDKSPSKKDIHDFDIKSIDVSSPKNQYFPAQINQIKKQMTCYSISVSEPDNSPEANYSQTASPTKPNSSISRNHQNPSLKNIGQSKSANNIMEINKQIKSSSFAPQKEKNPIKKSIISELEKSAGNVVAPRKKIIFHHRHTNAVPESPANNINSINDTLISTHSNGESNLMMINNSNHIEGSNTPQNNQNSPNEHNHQDDNINNSLSIEASSPNPMLKNRNQNKRQSSLKINRKISDGTPKIINNADPSINSNQLIKDVNEHQAVVEKLLLNTDDAIKEDPKQLQFLKLQPGYNSPHIGKIDSLQDNRNSENAKQHLHNSNHKVVKSTGTAKDTIPKKKKLEVVTKQLFKKQSLNNSQMRAVGADLKAVSSEMLQMAKRVDALNEKYDRVIDIVEILAKEIAELNQRQLVQNELRTKQLKTLPFPAIKRQISQGSIPKIEMAEIEDILGDQNNDVQQNSNGLNPPRKNPMINS